MHVVKSNEMYEIDRYTMEKIGLNGVSLMESAGRAVAFRSLEWLDPKQCIAILIGTGNNGGDGFVIARTLLNMGFNVDVWLIPPLHKVTGDARIHHNIFLECGYSYKPLHETENLRKYDVIFDAMLGIGVKGEVRSPYKEIITYCNNLTAFKIAVDVPSGISGDETPFITCAFRATVTITLQCPKVSAYGYATSSYYGNVIPVDIGIPTKAITSIAKNRRVWTREDVVNTVVHRSPFAHKGTNGKCLLIGGSIGMPGAIAMAAKAAHRSGAGLVTVAIPKEIYQSVTSHMLEATFSLWESKDGYISGEVGEDLTSYDVIAIGPGLGRNKEGQELVSTLLTQWKGPLLIDADGLYHVSNVKKLLKHREAPTILTPHAGEMARLADIAVEDLVADRFEISSAFAQEFGVYLVLKGPYSLLATPAGDHFVNVTGNASLAKGGSGDVLTGMVAAFIMHQRDVQSAISNAVYFHGMAADQLVKSDHSLIDVMAKDIIESLPHVFRTIF